MRQVCYLYVFQSSVDITVAYVVGLCMLFRVTARAYRLAVRITVASFVLSSCKREAVLHSDKFLWKSFEDSNAAHSHSEWKEWTSNPGKTKREKRMFRAFMTRMMKRSWTKKAEEAKCVVRGG